MNRAQMLDGGAYVRTAFQAIAKTATAGGSGDATQVAGAWVDRNTDYGIALSAKLVIVYEAIMADGETLSFAVDARDASDVAGSDAAAFGSAITSTIVATANSGGETIDGTVEVDLDLADAKEFIQARITPDLSASGTDTLKWSAALVLAGFNRTPATAAIGTIGKPS